MNKAKKIFNIFKLIIFFIIVFILVKFIRSFSYNNDGNLFNHKILGFATSDILFLLFGIILILPLVIKLLKTKDEKEEETEEEIPYQNESTQTINNLIQTKVSQNINKPKIINKQNDTLLINENITELMSYRVIKNSDKIIIKPDLFNQILFMFIFIPFLLVFFGTITFFLINSLFNGSQLFNDGPIIVSISKRITFILLIILTFIFVLKKLILSLIKRSTKKTIFDKKLKVIFIFEDSKNNKDNNKIEIKDLTQQLKNYNKKQNERRIDFNEVKKIQILKRKYYPTYKTRKLSFETERIVRDSRTQVILVLNNDERISIYYDKSLKKAYKVKNIINYLLHVPVEEKLDCTM